MEDYLKERKCIVVKRDNRGRCVEANEDIQKGSLISQAIVDNYILYHFRQNIGFTGMFLDDIVLSKRNSRKCAKYG